MSRPLLHPLTLMTSLRAALLSFLVLAGAATSRADDEKMLHLQFEKTDWNDVLVFYKTLTGREPNFASDFPKQLSATISLPATELSKSKAIELLEKAFQNQCGILLWPDPNSKTVTITYTGKPKKQIPRLPGLNPPEK
jgi:hypothetical protein